MKNEENTNSRVDRLERRKAWRCSYCRANRGENRGRVPEWGEKTPKRKTIRARQARDV